MIAFDTPARQMKIQLAAPVATNECPWVTTYTIVLDVTTQGTTILGNAVSVIPVPDGTKAGIRVLKAFSLVNIDTAPITLSVIYADGATSRSIITVTLNVGDSIGYTQANGWQCLDANGAVKTSSSGSADVSAAMSLATVASEGASVASSMASNALASVAADSSSVATASTTTSSLMSRWSVTVSKTSSSFAF